MSLTAKQRREQRQAINRALAERDRLNRCALCKLNLALAPKVLESLDGRRWCSEACHQQAEGQATA